MSFGRIFIATALVALLAACSTTHAPQSSSGSSPSSRGPEILPPSAPGTAPAITEQGSVPRVEKPARGANRPYTVLGRHYVPITGDKPMRERGIASWYGKQFHGKKTSNGEVFDMYSVPAAHKTMELPSYARVTNLENGRSMIIRINDRGPFYGDRIIDLSYEAAKRLGYAVKGTARVEVERITMAEIAAGTWNRTDIASSTIPVTQETAGTERDQRITRDRPSMLWSVQVGAFSSPDNARAWSAHTEAMLSAASGGRTATTRIVQSSDSLYRVLVGANLTHERATAEAHRIAGIIGGPAFATQR